jgi:hypothetical protein
MVDPILDPKFIEQEQRQITAGTMALQTIIGAMRRQIEALQERIEALEKKQG